MEHAGDVGVAVGVGAVGRGLVLVVRGRELVARGLEVAVGVALVVGAGRVLVGLALVGDETVAVVGVADGPVCSLGPWQAAIDRATQMEAPTTVDRLLCLTSARHSMASPSPPSI